MRQISSISCIDSTESLRLRYSAHQIAIILAILVLTLGINSAIAAEKVKSNSKQKKQLQSATLSQNAYSVKGFATRYAWTAGSSYNPAKVRKLLKDLLEKRKRSEAEFKNTKRPEQQREAIFRWNRKEQQTLHKRGRAKINPQGTMLLSGGAYFVSGINERILATCKKSNELTVETILQSDSLNQEGPARIVTFSSDAMSRNFTLGQEEDRLIFRLRTSRTDKNGTRPELTLTRIKPRKEYHVVVTYRPGQLACFVNGKQVLLTDEIEGDFSNWSSQHLLFGDEWNGQRDWSGSLKRVVILPRAIGLQQVQQNFSQSR